MKLIGTISGEVKPTSFEILLLEEVETLIERGSYVKIFHEQYGWVLSRIFDLKRFLNSQGEEVMMAKARPVGYSQEQQILMPRAPFKPSEKVYLADKELILKVIGLRGKKEGSIYLGTLEGHNIPVYLNLKKTLHKHLSVLAKTGAGKSYAVAVIVEELLKRKFPVVIIDPHGEYFSLKYENDDYDAMLNFNVSPKSYGKQIQEFAVNIIVNPEAKKLTLKPNFSLEELIKIMPMSLGDRQKSILYDALKRLESRGYILQDLINVVKLNPSTAKWKVVNGLESLRDSGVFEGLPIREEDLVRPGMASLINLKGVEPGIQELVVGKIAKDLFNAKKLDQVPNFFFLVEESHNFCPERGFGDALSSQILRTIASEGRKFGFYLGVVSQRPAQISKCVSEDTKIILKDGKIRSIKEIYEEHSNGKEKIINPQNLWIMSLDLPTLKNVPTRVKYIEKRKSPKKLLMIKTSRGNEIICTKEHKFFTYDSEMNLKEVEAEKLKVGNYLLTPKRLKPETNNNLIYNPGFLSEAKERKKSIQNRVMAFKEVGNLGSKEIAKTYDLPFYTIKNWEWRNQSPNYLENEELLFEDFLFSQYPSGRGKPLPLIKEVTSEMAEFFAMLIGEGYEVKPQGSSYRFSFINTNEGLLNQFEKLCKKLFNLELRRRKGKRGTHLIGNSNLLGEFLNSIGYKTCLKSKHKKIPELILSAEDKVVKKFLQKFFDCEGSVGEKGIYLTSTSQDVIQGICILLKRFGIIGSIYHKEMKYNGKRYPFWQIVILRNNLKNFKRVIGFSIKTKQKKLQELIRKRGTKRYYVINDIAPVTKKEFYGLVKLSPSISKKFKDKISRISHKRPILRHMVKKVIDNLAESPERKKLKRFLEGEAIMDPIKEIKWINSKGAHVYDLETETNNFIAGFGGIVTHNSILSQCSTQIILKVTNPNDLRALSQSIEGFTPGMENDIKELSIGQALVVGESVEHPIIVNIRVRESKHGGKVPSEERKKVSKEFPFSQKIKPLFIEDKKEELLRKKVKEKEKRKGFWKKVKGFFIEEE